MEVLILFTILVACLNCLLSGFIARANIVKEKKAGYYFFAMMLFVIRGMQNSLEAGFSNYYYLLLIAGFAIGMILAEKFNNGISSNGCDFFICEKYLN